MLDTITAEQTEKEKLTSKALYQNLKNFRGFEQLDKYQEIQRGCSPTLNVRDLQTNTDFWVSMAGDRNEHGYLIVYVYLKEKKGLFGLGKPKQIRWLEIRLT